jgi:hypothetical protein
MSYGRLEVHWFTSGTCKCWWDHITLKHKHSKYDPQWQMENQGWCKTRQQNQELATSLISLHEAMTVPQTK